MRKTRYVALTFFVLLCFSISPSLANHQMNISSWGMINYSTTSSSPIKILRQSFQNFAWSAEKFASIIDVWQGNYAAPNAGQAIENVRPDVITFQYFNSLIIRTGEPYFDEINSNNWWLRDAGGNIVKTYYEDTAYYVDFGNPAYHTWLANWYKNKLDTYGLDGASIDNWFVSSSVWYYTHQDAINPRTGTFWTNQEICDAYKAMTIKIRDTIGSGKHVLANGVYNGNHFYGSQHSLFLDGILNGGLDALMSEGWISTYDASDWYSEDLWKKGIDFAIWLENNWSQGAFFMTIHTDYSFATWGGGDNTFPGDMTEAQYQQYVLYGYASVLLTVQNLDKIIAFGGYIEYDFAQSLFDIDVGDPLGSYYMMAGTHVYARDFTKATVLVNPTYNSYTVTIGSGYKNAVTGSSVSSTLTVQPHTGLILTKA